MIWRRGGAFQPSVATVLGVGFGALILVAVGLVLALGLRSGLKNTEDLLRRQAMLTVSSISEQVRKHLRPARDLTESLARLAELEILDLEDNQQLGDFMIAAGEAVPQAAYLSYLDLDQRMVIVDLGARKPRVLVDDWSLDDQAEIAMKSLRHNLDSYWGPPLYAADRQTSLVNVRTPVTAGGEPRGLFAAAVSVDELSRHLKRLIRGDELGSAAFILSGPDLVVAYSSTQALVGAMSAEHPLPQLDQLGDSVLAALWDPERSRSIAEGKLSSGFKANFVRLDEGQFAVFYQYLHGFGPIPWIVGTYFPVEDVAEEFNRLRNAVVAGLVVLVVAVVSSLALGRRISLPVLRLARAARQLREQGPEAVEVLPSSHFKELTEASRAFNDMTEGLRERELILSTFGKYVPKSVVANLLTEGGRPPAETRTATILFSDIEGFSTISERLDPVSLVNLLNEYFTLISEPIERLGGVINQFQGDALVASFNIPIADANHAGNAVKAALEIQAQLQGRLFEGGHPLNTRIGINTGVVVGGAVGTPGRLSYTVHGDSVNVAARLEQLNKQWGTRVLISESTFKLCKDQFEFEHVDKVPIRGRSQTVNVYSVSTNEMTQA